MHLFKNKTKDVKQFLQEMKANKTNRSSNLNSLEKRQNKTLANSSPNPNDSYNTFSVTNVKNSMQESGRRSSMSMDSNRSFEGSLNSNQRNPNLANQRSFQSPPQLHQRTSQEQMNFNGQGSQPYPNEAPQLSQSYRHHIPEPQFQHENSYSNQFPPYQPSSNQFKPLQSQRGHQQSYHNLSQPNIHHPFSHRMEFHEQRSHFDNSQNFSQTSNSTIYDSPQHHHSNMSSQSYQKPLIRAESTHFMNKPSNHRMEPKINQHESPRNLFPSSQQLYNRFDYHNSFASQVSNIDSPMEEIREVQADLSTEKDSPAKFSEYFSKNKSLIPQFTETSLNHFAESNVFEVVVSDSGQSYEEEEKPQKIANIFNSIKNNNQTKAENHKISLQISPQPTKTKQAFNYTKYPQQSKQNQAKTVKIKVSEDQRHKLNKSVHQIHQSYTTLDQLFKQTSVLFNNIQRNSDQFSKNISEGGKYFKYMNPRAEKCYEKMEIEDEMKIERNRVHQTYRKQKPKQYTYLQERMDIHKTYKKSNSSDIQI